MIIELLENDKIFTIIETSTPTLEFAAYKAMFPSIIGWQEQTPTTPSLYDLKNQKLQEITTWTSLAITGGFISTCTGSEVCYDSDFDTQITMLALNANMGAEALAKRYPNGYPVRGYKKLLDGFEAEKTLQYLNSEQVVQFGADLSEHIKTQKQHGWELQERVKLATTSLELDSVVW